MTVGVIAARQYRALMVRLETAALTAIAGWSRRATASDVDSVEVLRADQRGLRNGAVTAFAPEARCARRARGRAGNQR